MRYTPLTIVGAFAALTIFAAAATAQTGTPSGSATLQSNTTRSIQSQTGTGTYGAGTTTGIGAFGTPGANGSGWAANQTTGTPLVAGLDWRFLTDAADLGMAEVNLADIAIQRAQDPQVRAFAQRMIADHTPQNAQIIQYATGFNVTIPAFVDRAHTDLATRLSRERGSNFDRQYMQSQVNDHTTAIALFQDEATNSGSDTLRTFAANSLPVLRDHLQMAQSILDNLQQTQRFHRRHQRDRILRSPG